MPRTRGVPAVGVDHRRHPFQVKLRNFRKLAQREAPQLDYMLDIANRQWKWITRHRRHYRNRYCNTNVKRLAKKLSKPARLGCPLTLYQMNALTDDLDIHGTACWNSSDGDSSDSGGPLFDLFQYP